MDALTFARWQFGITTAYHFFFFRLSIGLVFLMAVIQTLWMRSRDQEYLRMTRFFGMNWSSPGLVSSTPS